MNTLVQARFGMQAELRIRPIDPQRQSAVRARLLTALEEYAAALAVRGLSAPPRLRDELALQRNLATGR